MKDNYRKLGELVDLIDERNSEEKVKTLIGVSIDKCFIKSVANTIGTDLSKYQIIRKNDFACSLMQVSRDGKLPIACLKDYDEAIMSPAYYIFRIKDKNKILPDYLTMWFMRTEFDREASYIAVGGVRGSMPWEDFCNMELPVPDLTEQQRIVNAYNTVDRRIRLLQQINEKLEETAQQIYKDAISDSSNWKDGTINDVIVLHDSKRIPLGSDERINMKKKYPYYGAAALMDYVDNYIFDGRYLLLGEDGTVMDEKGYPILQYVEGKIWVNNHAHVLTGKNGYSIELLYLIFKNTDVREIVTGAVQLKINQENLKSIPIKIIDSTTLKQLDSKIQPIFNIIRFQTKTIEKLELFKEIIISKISKI